MYGAVEGLDELRRGVDAMMYRVTLRHKDQTQETHIVTDLTEFFKDFEMSSVRSVLIVPVETPNPNQLALPLR